MTGQRRCCSATMNTPIPFDHPFTLADARSAGISRSVVRGWLQRGEARQIAHGLFSPAHCVAADGVRVSRAVVEGKRACSFVGAAEAHGLLLPPDVHPPWRRPMRVDRIPPNHRTQSGTLLLPGAAWTAIALARFQPFPSALVPLDSALRLGVDRECLVDAVEQVRGWPGSASVAAALEHADPRSESALESLARGAFIVAELPMPVLQAEVIANHRRYRLDFLWTAARLILEVDGLIKYSDPEVMRSEKRRHNDLQAAGFTVLRCGFPNVYPNATALTTQLRRLLVTPTTMQHRI